MGYRSDVEIRIGFRSVDEMNGFIAAIALREPEADGMEPPWCPRKVLFEEFSVSTEHCVIYASYESVKWYDNFADVQAVERLMTLATELSGAMYKFVRVGEDSDDLVDEDEEGEGEYSEYPGWGFIMDPYPELVISNRAERAHPDDIDNAETYFKSLADSHTDVSESEDETA